MRSSRITSSFRAALAFVAALSAACGGSVDSSSASDLSTSAVAPLRASDFTLPITQASIQATQPELSPVAFAAKWQSAKSDALTFLRTFPPAWHADLAQVAAARLIGTQTICAGDAHFENFGFILLSKNSDVFALNDFDDSGDCPVANDAARFFTSVALQWNDDSLTEMLIATYVDVVAHSKHALQVDHSLEPDWSDVQKKLVANNSSGGELVLSSATGLVAVDASTRSAIATAIESRAELSGMKVRDVAELPRADGGSGGLFRYWILVHHKTGETILELKQLVEPGVEWGRHTAVLEGAARFPTLKKTFWGKTDSNDTFELDLLGLRFMLRDRGLRSSPDPTAMKTSDRDAFLQAEVSALALAHQSAWSGVSSSEISAWLTGTSATLTARWSAAWQAAQ